MSQLKLTPDEEKRFFESESKTKGRKPKKPILEDYDKWKKSFDRNLHKKWH